MPSIKDVYKRGFSLLLPFFLLLSCASLDTAREQEQKQDNVSPQQPAEPSEKPPLTLVTLEVDESFPLKETVRYQDGYVDSSRLYEYDEQGRLLKLSRMNREEQPAFQEVYHYNKDGLLEKTESFDKDQLVSFSAFIYNGDKQLIEERYYNSREKLMAVSSYEYNEQGQRIKWISGNSGGIPIMCTRYSYEGSRLVRVDYYTPDDELEGYTRMEYEQGVLKTEATYNANGRLEKKTLHVLEDGHITGVQYYRGKELLRSVEYKRDEQGRIVEETNLNRHGKVVDIVSREFIVFTVKKTVAKEG